MKEFKGTPGPWIVNEIGQHWNNKALTHLEITFGEDGECICDTVYQRADANLIAAAPELLEALQEILQIGDIHHSAIEAKHPLHDFESWEMKARAAIKKALGE